MNDMTRAGALVAAQTDAELIEVLRNSLYPGASDASAALVLGYCRAAGLDPMQKPVHIVPMRVKTGEKNGYGDDVYANRDTIMPGIGLYRVQAARTGQYAGQDQPEFGPTRTLTYQAKKTEWVPGNNGKNRPVTSYVEKTLEYPQWCMVTIYRLVGGFRSAFTAVEFWEENYATAGRDTDAPNEMWAKRVRGQLAKCAEAQALRKAFPEVGASPTAEEMEGRAYPDTIEQGEAPAFVKPARLSDKTVEQDIARGLVADAVVGDPKPLVEQHVTLQDEPIPVQPGTQQVATPEGDRGPAPTKPAAPVDTSDGSPPASAGECMNVIVTAKARKKDLGAVLKTLGLALDPATLAGLTKQQFKNVKAVL